MMIALGLVVAGLLVLGQTLWKMAAGAATASGLAERSWQTFLSPTFLAGAVLYVVATALYVDLLGKNDYFRVQSVVVPAALVLALAVSVLKFHERVSMLNLAGMVLLLIAIGLILKR
ncbi:MAG TPA: hypothetical protein VLF67_02105 [Candidatus Saccharimonas sp.]|nr:hypothetical protein [Candidatus Saccharimonas sp.]